MRTKTRKSCQCRRLQSELDALQAKLDAQQARMAALEAIVARLQEQLAAARKDSGTSYRLVISRISNGSGPGVFGPSCTPCSRSTRRGARMC